MFQFSIRTLLIVTTIFAVIVWILFSPPQWVGAMVLAAIFVVLPSINLAGLIYHQGYWRAFFVGTAPLVAWAAWNMLFMFWNGRWPGPYPGDDAIYTKVVLFVFLAMIGAAGFLAMAVRWWAQQIKRTQEPRGAEPS